MTVFYRHIGWRFLVAIARQEVGGGEQAPDFEAPVPVQAQGVPLDVNLLLQGQASVLQVPQLVLRLLVGQLQFSDRVLQLSDLLNKPEKIGQKIRSAAMPE